AQVDWVFGEKEKARDSLLRLFEKAVDPVEIASLYYELWAMEGTQEYRKEAFDRYKEIVQSTPDFQYKKCLQELSDGFIPDSLYRSRNKQLDGGNTPDTNEGSVMRCAIAVIDEIDSDVLSQTPDSAIDQTLQAGLRKKLQRCRNSLMKIIDRSEDEKRNDLGMINRFADFLSIIKQFSRELSFDTLLENIIDASIGLFKSDRGAVLMFDSAKGLSIKAARDSQKQRITDNFNISQTILNKIVNERKAVYLADVMDDTTASSVKSIIEMQLRSIMAAPLLFNWESGEEKPFSKDNFLGIIYLDCKKAVEGGTFTENSLALFNYLADQAAIALCNAMLTEELKKSHVELELRVDVRTRELAEANRKLVEHQHKIVKLNQILEEKVADGAQKLNLALNAAVEGNYRSEMAKLTTGTLHNVRNLLNTINISSDFIGHILKNNSTIKGLKQANEMLEKNKDNVHEFLANDQKGKKLIEYYGKLEHDLEKDLASAKSEIHRLHECVTMINQIISTQQSYNKNEEHDTISISKIIEDSILMVQELLRNNGITIEKKIVTQPKIATNRVKLMHILVNLLKNAAEAMGDIPIQKKTIIIQLSTDSFWTFIRVTDNGCGISEEQSQKMFRFGFTSKTNGHGFGLHSCKIYCNEMGGDLLFHSDGYQKGTTFTIQLPLERTNFTPRAV
ncbi:MAG: GHKL domain-containing protein, partial [Chitinivibrionales bacterium]|nr:GHKL domain-containing protein [Chitinivibrionales bacterium]